MSAARAELRPAQAAARLTVGQMGAVGVIGLGIALAGVLLALSLAPSASLIDRLMSSAGEARSGAVTQNLVQHLGGRLRLAGGGLLLLSLALLVLRRPFAELLDETWRDLRARVGHLDQRRTWAHAPIWLLMLVALVPRAVFLGQPMRYDEALSFNEFASRPLYYGLSFYPEPNNHLLNTLLSHFAYTALGNEPWVLRLPALIAGVLLVPATWALGRVLYSNAAGLVGAALVAGSSYLVEYSTNGRGYTLAALSFVLCFALTVVAVRRHSVSALLVGVGVAALGVYAVPTTVYGIVIIAAWYVLATRRWDVRLAVLALLLALAVALLYLPVVLISGPEALLANRFVLPLSAAELGQQLPTSLLRTWSLWTRDLPVLASALLALGFASASYVAYRKRQMPVGLMAVGVCLALVLLQRVVPFERVWLFLLPLYLLIAGSGLVDLTKWVVPERVAAAALVLAALGAVPLSLGSGSILASRETGAFPDAQAVTATLRNRLSPDDAVVTTVAASLPELQYYFPRAGLPIATLVRPPAEARRVYVVVPSDAQPPPLSGWTRAVPLAHYATAHLYELER